MQGSRAESRVGLQAEGGQAGSRNQEVRQAGEPAAATAPGLKEAVGKPGCPAGRHQAEGTKSRLQPQKSGCGYEGK